MRALRHLLPILLVLPLLLVQLTARPCAAHDGTAGEHVIAAVELEDLPAPVIDGRLDDPVWQRAVPASGFRQLAPERGAPATDDTEFMVAYDREHLYIGLRCYDDEPARIVNRIGRRGETFISDFVSIYIDPQHDRRTGYKFSTTPGGLQGDEYRFDDTSTDRNWRGVWWVEGAVDSTGWTAELKIPLSNFRFDEAVEQAWGFDLERYNKRKNEWTVWHQMTQAGDRTRMSDLGLLTGLRDVRTGRNLEVTPYALGGLTDGGSRDADGQAGIGVDLQANLASALKANLTVNPDFAQVEADQVEVNLTRFPTRFPEQRPFFVEGNGFFETPLDLFFSRRIGSRGDIVWAAKMTGKTGATSIGVLASQTGSAGILDVGGGPRLQEGALYTALRIKQDVLRRSHVGLLYTGKETDGGHGRVAGFDAGLSLSGAWQLAGQWAHSDVDGPVGEAAGDDGAVSTRLSFRDHLWDVALGWERVAPRFDASATGFVNKEPLRGWNESNLGVTWTPQWRRQKLFLGTEARLGRGLFDDGYIDAWQARNPALRLGDGYAEDEVGWSAQVSAAAQLTQQALAYVEVYGRRSREVELTHVFHANTVGASFESNSARPLMVGGGFLVGDFYNFTRQAPGSQTRAWLQGVWRPRTNASLELYGDLARTRDRADTVDGRFRVGSMRATWLFTRDLFVRLFAQTERQRIGTDVRTTDRRHLVSLLTGWEFRPKSHLFVAYNEDWSGPAGELRLGDRVLVVKLSYLSNL